MKLYAIQIKGPKGWEFGAPFYGLDIATGLVGGPFTGSEERALETFDERAKTIKPSHLRVIAFSEMWVVR